MDTYATLKTEHASRYLASMCRHFGHKVEVQYDGGSGRIELPFGQCGLRADESGLELKVSAQNQLELEEAVRVISNHLERFAFRENPELKWQPALEATKRRA